MNENRTATRVALLTPAGRGAIASIAVAGPHAVAAIDHCFRAANGRPLAGHPIDRIVYGRWTATGEEVVVARRGESKVEVHCHGGAAASEVIVSSLVKAGCKVVSWQAFMAADEPDPIRAAARIALANCATERTAAIMLDQYLGALEQAIKLAMRRLEQHDLAAAVAQLRELLSWVALGAHLTKPWQVVIAGPPNAGKSTLLNAILGYERAIVFDQPGTTRDLVTSLTAIDGWAIELADTAGLRASDEPLEQAGVTRATAEMSKADVAILVFDVTEPWTDEMQRLLSIRPDAFLVHNKADLLTEGRRAAVGLADRPRGMLVSAKDGWNMPALLGALGKRLVPRVPPPGAAVPFTVEQTKFIQAALAHAERDESPQAIAALARLVPSRHGQ